MRMSLVKQWIINQNLSSESQTRRQYRMTHSKMAEHICDLVADGMRRPVYTDRQINWEAVTDRRYQSETPNVKGQLIADRRCQPSIA
jgi:hypothetical protein